MNFRATTSPALSRRIAMLRITEEKTNEELLEDAVGLLEAVRDSRMKLERKVENMPRLKHLGKPRKKG